VLLFLAALVLIVGGAVVAAALARFLDSDEGGARSVPAERKTGAASHGRTNPRTASTLPTVKPGAPVTRTTPVPILMYHVIAAAPEDAPFPELYVSPLRFAKQMAHLARHRYDVVTLQQVWDHWHGGARLPRKPVVLSFDDGFRNWYTQAYPILRKHGWVGTMNLALNHLNGVDIPARLVRKLIAAGWELDSHSLTHPDLTLLSSRDLHREAAGSRTRLRKLFGVPVNFFCYPAGRYNDVVITEVRKAGYLGATTTAEGLAVPPTRFALRRVRINGSDDAGSFARKLTPS